MDQKLTAQFDLFLDVLLYQTTKNQPTISRFPNFPILHFPNFSVFSFYDSRFSISQKSLISISEPFNKNQIKKKRRKSVTKILKSVMFVKLVEANSHPVKEDEKLRVNKRVFSSALEKDEFLGQFIQAVAVVLKLTNYGCKHVVKFLRNKKLSKSFFFLKCWNSALFLPQITYFVTISDDQIDQLNQNIHSLKFIVNIDCNYRCTHITLFLCTHFAYIYCKI